MYPLHHLPLVLQLRELRRHNPNNHILVLRQMLQRLEPPRARRVVLEVIRRDVQVVEQRGRDAIVGALAEVFRADVVAAAEMDAEVEVGGPLETGVVEAHVGGELLVGGLEVFGVFLPAFQHGVGAEV